MNHKILIALYIAGSLTFLAITPLVGADWPWTTGLAAYSALLAGVLHLTHTQAGKQRSGTYSGQETRRAH